MAALDMLRSITSRLTSATTSVTSEIQSLRRRIDDTRDAIQAADRASVSRSELQARIRDQVQRDAAQWLREHGATFGVFAARTRPKPGYAQSVRSADLSSWGALCARDPEAALEQFSALCARAGVDYGPDAAGHAALVSRLTFELSELESAEERLIDEANAAGVHIAHRAEVIQRRQDEAIERDREERKITDRQARQDALNAQHRERTQRGPTRSSYLQGGGKIPAA